MNIEEAKEKKKKLEDDILDIITKYQKETGLHITSIDINRTSSIAGKIGTIYRLHAVVHF